MIDTLLRQWTLLRLLPRHPRRLEPARLKDKLDAMGIAVTLRTVQRDLNALAAVFPLEASAGKPQGWCWCQGARQLDLPSMDPHAALTFHLVEQHLRTLLPPATLANLACAPCCRRRPWPTWPPGSRPPAGWSRPGPRA